ncbi:MAG TPA: hypothetical protein VK618_13525 [Flavitalea sp.]|nr:hypothetical protein [Flavitalea sp.]
MIRYLAAASLILLSIVSFAQNQSPRSGAAAGGKLSAGAAMLFNNVKSSATPAEKNRIFQDINLKLSPDRKSFLSDEYPVDAFVYPTDMNKDGKEELFVVMGSVALYGNTGQGFVLYIRNNAGQYQQQPDIGGAGLATILTAKNLGYPDILIGGPGFEFPVYRWNGRKYAWHKKMKDGAMNNNNSTDIETYSKAYTGTR